MREVTMFSVFDFNDIEEASVFISQCYRGGNDSVYFENEDLRFVKGGDNSVANISLAGYSLLMGKNPRVLEEYNRWKARK